MKESLFTNRVRKGKFASWSIDCVGR